MLVAKPARSMLSLLPLVFLLGVIALPVWPEPSRPAVGEADEAQADEQVKLLEVAYEVASSYPLVPHIKNRSRAQEWVTQAAIDLGAFDLARSYADGIANYRRGKMYGLLAAARLEAGDAEGAKPLIDLTLDVSRARGLEDWQRGWVLAALAYTHAVKGEHDEAYRLLNNDLVAQSGAKELISKSLALKPAPFEPRMTQFAEMVSAGEFEQTVLVMWGYAGEYKRHYADDEKRGLILEAFDEAAGTVPGHVRLPMLVAMADHVLDGSDDRRVALTLELLSRAESVVNVEVAGSKIVFALPIRAELAALRYRAGQRELAREALSAVVSAYEAHAGALQNYEHGNVLRPIAEAYVVMGEAESARVFYRRALEQGLVNPNLRPRIRDFTKSVVSLALSGLEPGDTLWPAIRRARRDILGHD